MKSPGRNKNEQKELLTGLKHLTIYKAISNNLPYPIFPVIQGRQVLVQQPFRKAVSLFKIPTADTSESQDRNAHVQ